MLSKSEKLVFRGALGQQLAGRLERPDAAPRAYALFAHCFACGKDSGAAAHISRALVAHGIAVLCFDFTGLGWSAGELDSESFASNSADLVAAADHLRASFAAPELLIGHSLAGAAVIAAAAQIPEARAVSSIAAPSHPGALERLLMPGLAEIETHAGARVSIAGRTFFISKQLLDDVRGFAHAPGLGLAGRALLAFHSPSDEVIAIDNARQLFEAAAHPKGFVSLDGADHLLSRAEDAGYVAALLAAWVERYLGVAIPQASTASRSAVAPSEESKVLVEAAGRYTQHIRAGAHTLVADEPRSMGGDDRGPTPYQLLLASLGACTAITLRMYAERKQLPLDRVRVELEHHKLHARDCAECETKAGQVDRIERVIELSGALSDTERARLLEIADKCPVHRTLHSEVVIRTRLSQNPVVV